jgi:DNA-binding transcriptional MerR regulator
MRSGELIKKTKITRDTLRYYNKLGFLVPKVNPSNGYKEYTEDDVWMVTFIKSAQGIGFSLKDVKELAEHMQSAECKHKSLLPFLNTRLNEVEEKIKALQKIKKHLKFLIEDFEQRDCTKKPSELKL